MVQYYDALFQVKWTIREVGKYGFGMITAVLYLHQV
jgi:hypothetical protein